MARALVLVAALMSLLLGGCATTIRSDVTAFHQWPSDLRDKSFVFAPTAEQSNNLEYRSYENLVRSELLRLGFTEAPDRRVAALKVKVAYDMDSRDVRVVEAVPAYPMFGWPYYGPFYGPFYGSPWHRYGYSPFYDPFWYGPPHMEYQESSYRLFSRRLQIQINRNPDNQMLYDVTVTSDGRNGSLAAVMPYLVRSAFRDFPGPSGVPRQIELKVEN